MKFKKLVSVLCVGALAASMLAGCGGGSSEEAATTDTGAATSAEAEEGGETTEAVKFDELQTISMYGMSFYGDGGLTEVVDAINAISVDQINVQIEYTPMDVATYMEQIGLMLSGGEAFDLCLCTAIPVVSFSTMQAQNELMDISTYLSDYAPDLVELMNDYIASCTVDHAVYAIPCLRQYNTNMYILMRTDILDALGLTDQALAVDSWTDYEDLMKAVLAGQDQLSDDLKTNAVLGNTDQGGAIITSSAYNLASDDFSGNYNFDTLGDQNKLIFTDTDTDTVENWFATDDYKALLERVNNWYNEGLVYKDAATTEDSTDTELMNGIIFSGLSPSEYGVEPVKEAGTGYDLTVVEICPGNIKTTNGNTWAWAVPTTSENPEAAVAFLNLMYTNADIENLFVYGIEGRDYEVVDGEAVLSDTLEYQCSDFFFGNQFLAYPAEGNGATFREDALADMESAEISKYFGLVVSTDPIANELTAVANVITQYSGGLESGSVDPSQLDTFLSALDSSGVQTIIDYYQDCLNTWLEENQ